MLTVDVGERIGAVEAINHNFFLIQHRYLSEFEIKYQTLKDLEKFWNSALLKNEIKDFGLSMASAHWPATLCEKIF